MFALLPPLAASGAGSDSEGSAVITLTAHKGPALTLTVDDLKAAGTVTIQVKDDAGNAAEYRGVPLAGLLESSGVALGQTVRGERLAEYLLVGASDGYRVLFSLAEIDPIFRPRTILLCFAKNGAPLPEGEGPFRLVVEDEDRHARWVRHVTAVTLDQLEDRAGTRR